MRREEQMNAIRHNYPSVQIAVGLATVPNGAAYQLRNPRLLQINWSVAGGVEQSVHRYECLSGSHAFFRKFAAGRQAAVETEGHEDGLSDGVEVRQTAF